MLHFTIQSSIYFFLLLSMIKISNCTTADDLITALDDGLRKPHASLVDIRNGKNHTDMIEEPTYCDKPIREIIDSKELRDIYEAAGYFADVQKYSVAIQLYTAALEIETNTKQVPITKTHLAKCLLNSDDPRNWENGARYLLQGAKDYDIASAFVYWLQTNFELETKLLLLPEVEAIKQIVDLRTKYTDPGYWHVEE